MRLPTPGEVLNTGHIVVASSYTSDDDNGVILAVSRPVMSTDTAPRFRVGTFNLYEGFLRTEAVYYNIGPAVAHYEDLGGIVNEPDSETGEAAWV